MRYFIELSYKGTDYNGWQIQQNAPTVQDELQKGMLSLLGSDITVTGAGRTDTGVHASFYVAHFDYPETIPDPDDFRYHLNAVLPRDIAVKRVFPVRGDAHARFDAVQREYKYYIHNDKDPFLREVSWYYNVPLDLDSMNEAAAYLLEYDDFTSFAKLNSANKTNICHVSYARWERKGNGFIFTIRADRFLRNMVRAITGTLVDVGRGKISPGDFRKLIAARDLSLCRTSAPAQGLFLSAVKYPDSIGNKPG